MSSALPLKDPDAGGRADCSGDVEAEGVPCAVQAGGLQAPEHVSHLHGGELGRRCIPLPTPSEGPGLERVAGSPYPALSSSGPYPPLYVTVTPRGLHHQPPGDSVLPQGEEPPCPLATALGKSLAARGVVSVWPEHQSQDVSPSLPFRRCASQRRTLSWTWWTTATAN